MRLIKTKRSYTNAEGVKKTAIEFYLEVEGLSKPIPIQPKTFGEKGSSYNALNLVAVYVKDYTK